MNEVVANPSAKREGTRRRDGVVNDEGGGRVGVERVVKVRDRSGR